MRIEWVRVWAALRGCCSIYLLSAFLVLLGSHLSLTPQGQPRVVALAQVLTTHLGYQLLLVLVLAFLYRLRGEVRDPLILAAILGLFALDGLLVQHLYDWDNGDGRTAAIFGGASNLGLLLATAWALRVPLASRLVGTVAAVALFVRFGPAALVGSPLLVEVTPGYVAAGFLLAACLVPALWLPRTDRVPSDLPLLRMERWGIGAALGFGVLHFATIGRGFDRPFLLDYLAPVVILLGPVLERLVPELRTVRAGRLLTGGLPFVGLMLAALRFPPGLIEADWARLWPLTPFYLALLLATVVQIGRSIQYRSPALGHVAALLAAMACLGGDFAGILTATRYPQGWQVAAVAVVTWVTIVATRHTVSALAVQAFPAFVLASWLELYRVPMVVSYLLALAVGALAIEVVTGWAMSRWPRLLTVGAMTLLPLLLVLGDTDSVVRRILAGVPLGGLVLLGWLRRERLLWQLPGLAIALGLASWPFVVQLRGEIAPGQLVTQLGFLVLLLGFLHSVAGNWLREQWRGWWQDGTSPAARRSSGRRVGGSGWQPDRVGSGR